MREALGYGAPHYPLADHYDNDRGCTATRTRSWSSRATGARTSTCYAHRYITEDTELGPGLPRFGGALGGRRCADRARPAGHRRRLPRARPAPGPAHASRRWAWPDSTSRAALTAECCTMANDDAGAALRRRRRGPHGARHRDRLCLRGPPHRAGRSAPRSDEAWQQAARRSAGRDRAPACTGLAQLGAIDAAQVAAIAAPRRARGGRRRAARAAPAPSWCSKACPRRWTPSAKPSSSSTGIAATTPSSPRPPAASWSRSWPRWCSKPERFLNMHWLNPAYVIPVVELSMPPGHRCRRCWRAPSELHGSDRQAAGGVRRDARLHRAAAAGAGDERGGAHGRRGRGHRRGDRQGHALRPGPALRGARRGGVHRLRRLRHPAPREPRDVGLDRQRALCRAGHRRPHGGTKAGWA